jgi:hypothetical protein
MKFSTALALLSTATGVLATNRAVEIINGPIGGGNAEAENYNAMTTTAAEAMMGETTTAAAMMGETTPLMDELAMTTKAAKMGMSTEAAMTTDAAMMGMATEAAMMETSTEAAMMGMTTEAAMMAGESNTMAAAAAAMTHTVCPFPSRKSNQPANKTPGHGRRHRRARLHAQPSNRCSR